MSVSNTVSRNDYFGTASTAIYNYTFKIILASDLRVLTRSTSGVETTLVLGTDYTVQGVGNKAGGTITLLAGNLATGVKLTIRRVRPLTQNTDIRNQGDFYPEIIEDTFDNQTYVSQQQQDHLNRTVSLPQTVTSSEFDPRLPASIIGASSVVLATSPTGTGLTAGPTLSDISTAISLVPTVTNAITLTGASVTAAAASATQAATSATNASNSATAASNSASAASGSVTAAGTQATNAQASATLAKDWANKTSGQVDGVEYSAKYYAQTASAILSSKINRTGDTMTGPLAMQDILKLAQEVNTSLTGSNVTLSPTRSHYKIGGAVTSIQAITPPTSPDGALLVLVNGIGNSFTVRNAAGGANNSIATGTAADIALATGATLWLVYDNASTVWRVIGGTGSGGGSLPNGGTVGQVLAKNSSTNGDASWFTIDKTSVGLGNVDNTSDATKTVLNAQNVLGTVGIANGGTGATTRQNAINNLAGTQSAGTFLRSDGTNTGLSAIQASDVPTLNQNTTGNAATATTAGNITGVAAIANGGTGQTTQQAALNALTGTQTAGRYLKSDGTNSSLSSLLASDLSGTVAKVNGGTGADNTNVTFPTTGTLATLNGVETFTNKTLSSPTVSNQANFSSISTPANPSAGNVRLYTKADGKFYTLDSTGLEQPIDANVASYNYILGGDGETGLGQLGQGYTDTAVPTSVVSGGASRITITNTLPLAGANSLLFTPISTIGGQAIPFTVRRMDFGAILQGDIQLEIGGTGYVDGALQFWIVTPSGAVVQPSGFSVSNFLGIGRIRFTFQTEVTGTQYYLKVHQSTTVSTWTAKMEISLARQVVSTGAFAGALPTYTPTASTGTFTFNSVQPSRQADGTLNLDFKATSTAAGSGVWNFSLPPGLSFDSSVLLSTIANGISTHTIGSVIGGDAVYTANAGPTQLYGAGIVVATSATTFSAVFLSATNGTLSGSGNAFTDRGAGLGSALTNSGAASVSLSIRGAKIAGWASSQILSQDAGDGRVVSFNGTSTTNQSVTANVTDVSFTTVLDRTNGWTGSTYIVSTPGDYQVVGNFAQSAASNAVVYVNGVIVPGGGAVSSTCGPSNSVGVLSAMVPALKANDVISIRFNVSGTAAGRTLSISRLSTGNQQIAASESVIATYGMTTSQSVAANAVIKYDTKLKAYGITYDPATGLFSVSAPGQYRLGVTSNIASGTNIAHYAKVNGSGAGYIVTALSAGPIFSGSIPLNLLAGATVGIYIDSATSVNGVGPQGFSNQVTLERTGNY